MPPIQVIIKWLKEKKIPVTTNKGTSKARGTGKRGSTGKLKKISKRGLEEGVAWAIAKSISKEGIKPFNFLKPYEEAVEAPDMMKDIRAALVKDGYKNLSKPIAEFNKKQAEK